MADIKYVILYVVDRSGWIGLRNRQGETMITTWQAISGETKSRDSITLRGPDVRWWRPQQKAHGRRKVTMGKAR